MHRTLAEFLTMGGYAGYVWPAYAIWLVVVVANVWSARSAHASAVLAARRRIAMRADAGEDAS